MNDYKILENYLKIKLIRLIFKTLKKAMLLD